MYRLSVDSEANNNTSVVDRNKTEKVDRSLHVEQQCNDGSELLLSPLALNQSGDAYLFPPALISQVETRFNLQRPPADLCMRPLKRGDYERGFLQVLAQLTVVGKIGKEQFLERFKSMANCTPLAYYVLVIEERNTERIVGCATLVVEWKFIHAAGCRGRVEDVVVRDDQRGKQLGKILNQHLVAMAEHLGCYKVSLECRDKLIGFYEQFGFAVDKGNNYLVRRFEAKI